MTRTRSRPKTEQKFKDAVLQIISKDGCGAVGISAVAQVAGADKVLIYRYFENFEGLLKSVAADRRWILSADEVVLALPGGSLDPRTALRAIAAIVSEDIRSEPCVWQLMRWRHADRSPISDQLTNEWHQLWAELPAQLCQNQSSSERHTWATALSLLALMVEAELCGEPVERDCLELMGQGLSAVVVDSENPDSPQNIEERLPTNLL